MKRSLPDARVTPFPPYKQFAAAAYWSVRHKPAMHGLLEVDVTEPRAILRAHHARTGATLSFTAFLTVCLGKAVDEHKPVQALRQGKRKLVVFEDVDVATRIERVVDGAEYVGVYVVRAANRKTVREVHDEIRTAQRADAEKEVVVQGRVAVREMLSLTISLDHNVVDGAPATRFTRRLKELIESAYGLESAAVTPRHERGATP